MTTLEFYRVMLEDIAEHRDFLWSIFAVCLLYVWLHFLRKEK